MRLERYAPFLWTAISNRWTASLSRACLEKHGIGIVEWRVLATLDAKRTATALDAARLAVIDPGAASRAMQRLREKGYVAPVEGRFAGRQKPYELTNPGVTTVESVKRLAGQRIELMLADLDETERGELLRLLNRVYACSADLP